MAIVKVQSGRYNNGASALRYVRIHVIIWLFLFFFFPSLYVSISSFFSIFFLFFFPFFLLFPLLHFFSSLLFFFSCIFVFSIFYRGSRSYPGSDQFNFHKTKWYSIIRKRKDPQFFLKSASPSQFLFSEFVWDTWYRYIGKSCKQEMRNKWVDWQWLSLFSSPLNMSSSLIFKYFIFSFFFFCTFLTFLLLPFRPVFLFS